MKKRNCVFFALIGLALALGLSSCSVNKPAVYVPSNFTNLKGAVDSLSISEDRLLVLESIMKTREFKKYVKANRKLNKKMKPYTANMDKEVVDDLKANVGDIDYVLAFMRKLDRQIDLKEEERNLDKALTRLGNVMEKKHLSVWEKALLFINARELK